MVHSPVFLVWHGSSHYSHSDCNKHEKLIIKIDFSDMLFGFLFNIVANEKSYMLQRWDESEPFHRDPMERYISG